MRTKSIITGQQNIEHLHTVKAFPVYMGCVPSTGRDKKRDLIFDICKDTGVIQLRNTLSLSLTNPYPHNDSVGEIWKQHNTEFINFIRQFKLNNIVELGGGSGKLAHEYLKYNKSCTWSIFDKNYFGKPHTNINVQYEWFNQQSNLTEYDAIIHSHVFEHIHNPIQFLKSIRKNVNRDSVHIFSLPNLYEWLKNKYMNCLNFEHTVFLTEDIVDVILKRVGFEIIQKEKYKDHSIFYACKPVSPELVPFKNHYDEYKNMFIEFVNHYDNLIQNINKKLLHKDKVYLFGAHIFSQYLIFNGLNISNIECILDNSKLKQGQRLYGTNLYVNSPMILKNQSDVTLILLAGSYTQEIKNDIIYNINNKVTFIP